jgi:hypothetical protein
VKSRYIEDFAGLYEVSESGVVSNSRTGRALKPRADKDGYMQVSLWSGSPCKKSDKKVHRLVALAFLENQESKPHVNHKNGDRSDNALANLEWATCSENHLHAYRVLGRQVGNERAVLAQKPGESMSFGSILAAARAGFNRRGIHQCLRGAYTHHKGFQWSYANV